ncbi:MAG: putative transcription factor IIIB 90 kDa subunit, partial [Streblomastix strix]
MVGQFVPNSGGGVNVGGHFLQESREVTIRNAKRRIGQLADLVGLNHRQVESAVRLYLLAVQMGFLRGRRSEIVHAVCLYIVCRRDRTHHMLIDFSDKMQINVFILGACLLKFIKTFHITMPIIDPSLFIHRFSANLDFGEKTHQVSLTALKLVQQMKRDWIVTGRSPAGVCGAALLIAARIHNFERSQKQIVEVVRICNHTLRNRLLEFEETPTAHMSLDEFNRATDELEKQEELDENEEVDNNNNNDNDNNEENNSNGVNNAKKGQQSEVKIVVGIGFGDVSSKGRQGGRDDGMDPPSFRRNREQEQEQQEQQEQQELNEEEQQ